MKLDYILFEKLAEEAAKNPRLRKHLDLRDSEEENGQRMLNVLQPGSIVAAHRHLDTTEVVVCIHGTAIERYYDENGNETDVFMLKAGGECPGLLIPAGQYHSLETNGEMTVIIEAKAGRYDQCCNELLKK